MTELTDEKASLELVEKLLPWKATAAGGIALLLLVLGLAVAFAPASVPGLTLPGSPPAMHATRSIEGSMDGQASAEE